MAKVNIKAILHNKTENKYFSCETVGIKNNNSIKFIDDNIKVLIDIKEDEILLSRRSKEYTIDMDFINNTKTKGLYYYKDLGSLNMEIYTNYLDINEKYIEIRYNMILEDSKQEFGYRIEIEEIK